MPSLRTDHIWPQGEVRPLQHQSAVLAGNPWQDPIQRTVHVYLPPGYRQQGKPHIALWDLAAFTNSGWGHVNWRNHGENLPQRLDRLIGQGTLEPVVVVMPDCYTSLGGNQYVNSVGVGRYADYLVDELVPFVSEHVNVFDGRQGRGLFGKSSGGFGALFHAMEHSATWGAAASHSGDVGFEWVYRSAFPDVCSVMAEYDYDPLAFVSAFWSKNRPSGRDFNALLILAMAASYDPDPEQPDRIRLPFDTRTCVVDPARWQKWLSFDPINRVEHAVPALRSMHALYFDVGVQDQYHIQYGTRRLADELQRLQVPCHYEEFEGSHSGIDWRLDHSLPYLADALKKACAAAT